MQFEHFLHLSIFLSFILFIVSNLFLSSTANECRQKWVNIRDNYQRQKNKLGTGSAGGSKMKRQEELTFLDDVSSVRKE